MDPRVAFPSALLGLDCGSVCQVEGHSSGGELVLHSVHVLLGSFSVHGNQCVFI